MNQLTPDSLLEACVCNGIHGSTETIDWIVEKIKDSGVLVVDNRAVFVSGMPVFKHDDATFAKAAAMEQAIREKCKTILLEKTEGGVTMREYDGKAMHEAMCYLMDFRLDPLNHVEFLNKDPIRFKVRF